MRLSLFDREIILFEFVENSTFDLCRYRWNWMGLGWMRLLIMCTIVSSNLSTHTFEHFFIFLFLFYSVPFAISVSRIYSLVLCLCVCTTAIILMLLQSEYTKSHRQVFRVNMHETRDKKNVVLIPLRSSRLVHSSQNWLLSRRTRHNTWVSRTWDKGHIEILLKVIRLNNLSITAFKSFFFL